ncbi:Redox-sensitive transcriptional regulator (AT-rich DNA-binding protein) [Dissulfuribacter thermophilus]|uniref:Redox-sensing transcriptional repressor Rex n=1 Tax=Dissulfuribacter thermophilus TaxID=1156395 RepID=A0A1B9F315_9BACT|nr:redox-sensing transcriptional repressor Rex [Dissulfuribacter thermophilus]OCC14224.1 Redox-sensitive transcriptional regulator (AT-rich DNA-binding protein) [Dissulfuribacter thermophilus]
MEKVKKIPSATIFRLSVYRQHLQVLRQQGRKTISSVQLACAARVNPAQLRKDLSYFGKFGVPGVGYDVDGLLQELSMILGARQSWKLCLLGAGKVGKAIVMSGQFERRGYFVEAIFDSRDEVIGTNIGGGLIVHSVTVARRLIPQKDVALCMVIEEVPSLDEAVNELLLAGIKGFLSFVPVGQAVPPNIPVQYMDFSTFLDALTYTLTHNKEGESEFFLENGGHVCFPNSDVACVQKSIGG